MSKMIRNAWRSPFFLFNSTFAMNNLFAIGNRKMVTRVALNYFFSLPRLFETTFWFCDHKIRFECNRLRFFFFAQKLHSLKLAIVYCRPVYLRFQQRMKCYVTRVYNLIPLDKSKEKRKKRNKCWKWSKLIRTNEIVRSVRLQQVLIKTVCRSIL